MRGIGLIESTADVENIVIGESNGTPVYVRNIAEVKIDNAFRTGALDKNGTEAVGGVVIARYGVNTLDVINAVKQKIEELKVGLPEGVKIVPFYDRTQLINRATSTLKHTLLEELLLVTLAHIVFLAHFRSILIVTIPLPLAVLISFLFMYYAGISSNIMSLSGIAIAIGVLVDAGIVVMENAFRFMEQREIDPKDRRAVWETILESTKLVGRPVFFSMAIIILAFIPVFSLTGQEGKLFHPLAFTKTFAMIGATIIAVTLVPVLCTYLVGGKVSFRAVESGDALFVSALQTRTALGVKKSNNHNFHRDCLVFGGAIFLASGIGREFMPPLNEGDLMFMPVTDPAISIDEALKIMSRQDEVLKTFPEVESAVGKAGRAETSTDPAPINMNETIVHLKAAGAVAQRRYTPIADCGNGFAIKNAGRNQHLDAADYQPHRNAGDGNSFGSRHQNLRRRFEKTRTNFAPSRRSRQDIVPGAADVYPEQIIGAPYIDVDINRQAAARYGIDVGTIQNAIEMGIGETNLSTTIEGRNRFPVRVRFAPEFRKDAESIGQLPLLTASGMTIPLAQVTNIRTVNGASMISSENGLLQRHGFAQRARARCRLVCRRSESGGYQSCSIAERLLH